MNRIIEEAKPTDMADIMKVMEDTHRDNTIMQHLITKHGFTYCGIILLANGDERLAYQKIASTF